jgi:DNA-binding Lrp family transcriptional regulator
MPKYQKAFVLIKTDPGEEREVLDALMKLDGVREVHIVPGQWDLLAVIEAVRDLVVPSDETIYSLVIDKIQKTKHVADTNTMVSHFAKTKES